MQRINEEGYVSFKESISDFFHGLIDFKGTTTRRGYLFPMLYYYINLFIGTSLVVLFTMIMKEYDFITIFICIIVAINYIFSNLAIIPVTVRRFRDIGFNIFVTVLLLVLGFGICPFFGIILPSNCFKRGCDISIQ